IGTPPRSSASASGTASASRWIVTMGITGERLSVAVMSAKSALVIRASAFMDPSFRVTPSWRPEHGDGHARLMHERANGVFLDGAGLQRRFVHRALAGAEEQQV